MRLLEILATHGGTATRAQLAAVTDRHLEAAVRAGLVLRTARGRYADPRAAPELLAASALDAVVSHESAAWLWRLGVDRAPPEVRLTVPRARNRARTRSHALAADRPLVRWTDLAPYEVVGRVTSPLRTALDCATSMPFPRALAVADAALRGGLVPQDALVVAAARWRGARRPAVVRIALAGDGRADNPFSRCCAASSSRRAWAVSSPRWWSRAPGRASASTWLTGAVASSSRPTASHGTGVAAP